MISKKKIIAIVLFIFMSLIMFAFANPDTGLDDQKPTITVNPELVKIVEGTDYDVMTGVTVEDDFDTLTATADITDTTDLAIGDHEVTYTAIDSSDNEATATRTIRVLDPKADEDGDGYTNGEEYNAGTDFDDENDFPNYSKGPTITENNVDSMEVHGVIPVFTATANDVADGVLPVTITNNINRDVVGLYQVTFRATDSLGNVATIVRNFRVVDTTDPIITLIGKTTYKRILGLETYTDEGADVTDNYDAPMNILGVVFGEPLITGIYQIRYNHTDANGNAATQVIRTIKMLAPEDDEDGDGYTNEEEYNHDTNYDDANEYPEDVAPVLTVDPASVEIFEGDSYDLMTGVTATDDFDSIANGKLIITMSMDSEHVSNLEYGMYTITYTATDRALNTDTETRSLKVLNPMGDEDEDGFTNGEEREDETDWNDPNDHADTNTPIIDVENISIPVFGTYTEDYEVTLDSHDLITDIDETIIITGTVNTNVLGTYTLTYSITDRYGKTGTATKEVTVYDNVKPVITLNGSASVIVRKGHTYTDAGATALDNYDGNITANIVTVNPVNKNVKGVYTVKYNVKDSSNNQAIEVTRTVYVVSVDDLEDAMDEARDIFGIVHHRTLAPALQDLIDDLGDAYDDGEDIIDNHSSAQTVVDNQTTLINNIIDQIRNLEFKVRFVDFDNSLIVERTVKFNMNATAPSNPSRVGYNFTGWDRNYHNVLNNITIKAEYHANHNTPYTVVTKKENIDGSYAITTANKTGTTDTTATESPSNIPGFTLDTVHSTLSGNIAGNGSLVLTIIYTRNTYTMTYKIDNVVVRTDSYKYGQTITKYTPSKTGYTFNGWNPVEPSTMPANNMTLNGSYTINQYTLSYYVDGVLYNHFHINYNASITPLTNPSKVGYTFSGWSTIPSNMPNHDVRIDGTYSANTHTAYTVTTKKEKLDGTYDVTNVTKYGTTDTTATETPGVITGYTLDTAHSTLSGNIAGNGSLVLTITYKRNTYSITYRVTGESNVVRNYKYQQTVPAYTPSKTGYTFSGWDNTEPSTMPANNVTLNGFYTINSYSLDYYVDNVLYNHSTKDYNAHITALGNPSKSGYTFSGWSTIPSHMPDHNVRIDGTFSANTHTAYTVTTKKEKLDGTYDVTNVTKYGTTDTTATETPGVISGFTLDTAHSTLSGNIAGNGSLVLTITYTRNTYTLTYNVDGVLSTFNYKFEQGITPIANPNKTNFSFIGWSPVVPATMPANNLTVIAQFTAQQTGIYVEAKPNVKFVFTKDSIVNISNYINVYNVFADGTKVITSVYTTNFSTATVADNKVLTVTQGTYTNTSITYDVVMCHTFQTKFEVSYTGLYTYRETKHHNCDSGDCDTISKTKPVNTDYTFLEVTQHYLENISISNISIKYVGETNYNTLQYSNPVRWSYKNKDEVRIASFHENGKVVPTGKTIDEVTIRYNRSGVGNFTITFKYSTSTGLFTAISEVN